MPRTAARFGFRPAMAVLVGLLVGTVLGQTGAAAQTTKDFVVTAHKYAFVVEGQDKPEIHVKQGDLVRIHFSTEDIPHSFTVIDHDGSQYRIMRRAEPGKPVTFEFRADKAGRFAFRCTLTIDPGCKNMEGWLIVDPVN